MFLMSETGEVREDIKAEGSILEDVMKYVDDKEEKEAMVSI